jgi:hypothetical protein
MAAVALLVTNGGLVQLAGVQPAHAVTTFLVMNEEFDGVAPPALPNGWTAARVAGQASDQTWQTSTPGLTSNPNSVSVSGYGHVTDLVLDSAPFVAGPATRMRFFAKYTFQATTGQFSGDNVDGAVLEIKIGSAGYVDFLAAGGSFNTGEGYTRHIANTQNNPLGGRNGWAGISAGAIHNGTLPSSANAQTVRLRWRVGTSTHTANQGGTGFFQSQAFVIDHFEVVSDKSDQTISFTSTPPANPQVGNTYTPTATATSGLPVAFSIASGSSSVCSIGAANLVTFNATGSCVIQANQAGNGGFTAAPQVTQSMNVGGKEVQTISFTSSAPNNPPVGATYTPTATSTSGLTVILSIAAGSSSVCSIGAADLVTFNATGSCVIQADQPGSSTVWGAAQVTQSVNVVAAPRSGQTISFTSTAPVNPQVGSTYTPTATATSGLPVVLTIAGASSAVCSIGVANLVTFNATGSCVIHADQAGNGSFTAAPRVTQSVNVVAAPPGGQTISFTSTAPVNPVVGATYTPTATATSGLPVAFSIAGASSAVCSIGVANLVAFNATGSCVIQADQAGNGSFTAAPRVSQSVNVVKAGQTISFTSTAPLNPAVGATYTPAATATSGLPVTFSIASASSAVCSLGAANLVSFNAPGSCVIQANQAGNGGFTAAAQVTQSVNVVKAGQTISFTSTAPLNPAVGATYTPAATATSGLPVTFSIASASSAVCSIGAANLVSFNAPGSCVIQANQAGNGGFTAAAQQTQTVNVTRASQTISFTSTAPVNPPVGATYTPTATASSGLPVTFSIAAGSSSVCSIGAANLVTFNAPGACVIQANQAGNANFTPAPQVTQSVTVVQAPQTITFTSTAPANPPVGATYTPVATGGGSGNPVTFTIAAGSSSVCSIGAANLVSFNAPGSCVIQANQAGNANFAPAPQVTQSLTVVKATPILTTQASPGNLVGAPVRDVATLSGGFRPTGSVTFKLYSDTNCTAQVFTSTNNLPSPVTSDWTTPATAGTYRWIATYNGDANNDAVSGLCTSPNESVTQTPFVAPAYTRTINGDIAGPLTVSAGESVLVSPGVRVLGPVNVAAGGALTVMNAQISGAVTADNPRFLSICGTGISVPAPDTALRVSNAQVPIRIGDPDSGCAGNQFVGQVTLTANLAVSFGANIVSHTATINSGGPGNTVIKANTVYGTLACSANTPAPTNAGQPNTAGSKTGQCAAL